MRPKRLLLLSSLTLALVLHGLVARPIGSARLDLPASLTDQEFWRLTEELSEPNGAFTSDNLLSNERVFARLVPDLIARTKPGGVYLGVGPEQNFTYIAAMRPRMAFITDIRRGNLHLQLMYKALFELSADRAEFVSRLFTKPRPAGLTATSTVTQLMDAYWEAFTSNEAAYAANLQAIQDHLTKTRALPLSAEDLGGIAAVYRAFYWYGPAITWSARISLPPAPPPQPPSVITMISANGTTNTMTLAVGGTTYWDIVTQSDASGGLTFLASEDTFKFLKDLERKNLIVPVVGNFSGPKALRAVGAYVRDRGATVSAFYVSNVEGYLQRAGTWGDFCANVATMPLDESSVFIRPNGLPRLAPQTTATDVVASADAATKIRLLSATFQATASGGLIPMAAEVKACAK